MKLTAPPDVSMGESYSKRFLANHIRVEPELQTRRFYHPELDVLRFLAFLGVFVFHVLPSDAASYSWLPAPLAEWIGAMVVSGAFGVDLFFALSAYLITTLLLR